MCPRLRPHLARALAARAGHGPEGHLARARAGGAAARGARGGRGRRVPESDSSKVRRVACSRSSPRWPLSAARAGSQAGVEDLAEADPLDAHLGREVEALEADLGRGRHRGRARLAAVVGRAPLRVGEHLEGPRDRRGSARRPRGRPGSGPGWSERRALLVGAADLRGARAFAHAQEARRGPWPLYFLSTTSASITSPPSLLPPPRRCRRRASRAAGGRGLLVEHLGQLVRGLRQLLERALDLVLAPVLAPPSRGLGERPSRPRLASSAAGACRGSPSSVFSVE